MPHPITVVAVNGGGGAEVSRAAEALLHCYAGPRPSGVFGDPLGCWLP